MNSLLRLNFRSQFPLYNFLSKFCNFNLDYVTSNLAQVEGFGAEYIWLINRDQYAKVKEYGFDVQLDRIWGVSGEDEESGKTRYQQFVLNLEGGILNCNQPLLPNTEVKFSFERLPARYALFYEKMTDPKATTLDPNKPIDIIDCYLELEYVSSPYLRNLSSQIIERPITYHYDDCQIFMKDLPKGAQTLRVNSLCGGLTPEYIFAGFMPAKCFDPDYIKTSIRFDNPSIQSSCITLNGAPVQGYPISSMIVDNPMQLYSKFLDSIHKWKKSAASSTLPFTVFAQDFCLLSHHFEGEQSNEGWIGFDIKFTRATDIDYTFGMNL